MLTRDNTVLPATHTFIHNSDKPYLPLLPSHRASPHFGWYSFPVPLRVGGWVGLANTILRFHYIVSSFLEFLQVGSGSTYCYESLRINGAFLKVGCINCCQTSVEAQKQTQTTDKKQKKYSLDHLMHLLTLTEVSHNACPNKDGNYTHTQNTSKLLSNIIWYELSFTMSDFAKQKMIWTSSSQKHLVFEQVVGTNGSFLDF